MSAAALTALIARCRVVCRPRSQADDIELLRRFAQRRDAAAFEELLERYAALVWGVCRRIVVNEADCEDAFQATFLALVRRAGAVEARPSLGAWLHTVAVRVARKTLARSRRQHPQAFVPEPATAGDVADEAGSRELFRMVDEEIERLPAAVRLPLILCCLQGRTRDEAAASLGCSVAAVKSRLERGRELLRRGLQRRGVQLPAAFVVLSLTSERIRAALWSKTMQSVLYTPAPAIIALAEAGVSAVAISKYKLILAGLLFVSSAAGFGTLLTKKPTEAPVFPQAKPMSDEPKKPEAPQVRRDHHDDPLPDGAIARLGTVRWRHGIQVLALAYSPDGKKIAAVGRGRDITLWDAATGKEIRQFPTTRYLPLDLAFSPDSKILATTNMPGNSKEKVVTLGHLWDVATGKELQQLRSEQKGIWQRTIRFSPDGKRLATASSDNTARIWDASTGRELQRLDCKQGNLNVVAYSPDGKLLATAGKDGTICLWDSETGTERRRIAAAKNGIWSLAFLPDGKQLAAGSGEAPPHLWDVASGRQLRTFGDEGATTLASSPDGNLLASGYSDGMCRLWETASGKEKGHWRAGPNVLSRLAFSPDGKTLVSAGVWDGSIRRWDVVTGKEKQPSDEHRGYVFFLRFTADGTSLISMGRENSLLHWDLKANTPRRLFSWTTKRNIRSALSRDGNTLATDGWPDAHLRLWDIRTGKPGRALGKPQQQYYIGAVAFSPDGRLVASEGQDRAIHVWDVRDGKEIQQFKGYTNLVNGLCFSPDSKALACCFEMRPGGMGQTDEPMLRFWDVYSGKTLIHFNSHDPELYALEFSSDGKVLAVSAGDWSGHTFPVQLWEMETGKELCRHVGHKQLAGAIAFSPDGKIIASGGGDNSVHVWEAATGRLIRSFEGHHSGVGSVDFSPDGLSVASGAGDSTILLWDITGRRPDGKWHAQPRTPRQLDACWKALVEADAAKAYDAVWALVASAEQAVPFLARRLPPLPRPAAKTVARLIADLDRDDFRVREQAMQELSKLGDAATSDLRRALESKPSLEMRRRIQQLLNQTRDWTAERLRIHRAILALEHIGTRQAKEVLQSLAAGAPDALRTEEAKAALRRCAK